MKSQWHLLVAASFTILGGGEIGHTAEIKSVQVEQLTKRSDADSSETRWTPVQAQRSKVTQQPQWQELNPAPKHALPEEVVWTQVEPSVAADIEEKIEDEAPINNPANEAVAFQAPIMPSGATFANDKAIWRDDTLRQTKTF